MSQHHPSEEHFLGYMGVLAYKVQVTTSVHWTARLSPKGYSLTQHIMAEQEQAAIERFRRQWRANHGEKA